MDVVSKIEELQDKIDEENQKPLAERDKKKELDLVYQQLIQGMKLSVCKL
jgi:hypothetical protein